MDYLDFGSSSDSDNDDMQAGALDSDDEERQENKRLLQMFNLTDAPSKTQRHIQDFEAEMEAELDRRALEIESLGGMEHQKSLSRSSSTSSLNKSPRASPVPGTSRPKPKKSCLKRVNSSEPDVNVKSVKFQSNPTATSSSSLKSKNSEGVEEKSNETYDKLYFDSDESDGEDNEKEKKRRFMTNDELFYDPTSDAKDQAWIDDQRRKSYGESNANQSSNETPSKNQVAQSENTGATAAGTSVELPTTDAILNCPACFTTVCHDCQRHELYVGQYRAMFVINCVINKLEKLTVPEKAPKKFRKRRKENNTNTNLPEFISSNSKSDAFHPVVCRVCKTQVAMYDDEEVYHFFNVLASQP